MAAYTADRTKDERAAAQASFEEGRLRIIVATTAFGLGINKRDIRWVRRGAEEAVCWSGMIPATQSLSSSVKWLHLARAGRVARPQ